MLEFIIQDILVYSLWEMTEVVGMVVFLANTVSMWLPNHSKYRAVQVLLDILNKLSLNIARNANRLHHSLEATAGDRQQSVDDDIYRETVKMSGRDKRVGGRKP